MSAVPKQMKAGAFLLFGAKYLPYKRVSLLKEWECVEAIIAQVKPWAWIWVP